jgi:hypothetical protein
METLYIAPKETLKIKITCQQHGEVIIKVRAPSKSKGIAISGITCPFLHWPTEKLDFKQSYEIKHS